MTGASKDLAASVRQRLKNLADAQGRPFQEALQYYAIERFLSRLGASRHRESFLLKGAMMLAAWRAPSIRPTLDIDLLGRSRDAAGSLAAVVRELCAMQPSPPDGLVFDPSSVETEDITVDAEYVGTRATFRAALGSARILMQIDLGVGDAVVAPQMDVELPTLLDFPSPRLHGYSRDSVVAEKLHAMVVHGRLNSRMKDYYDVMSLARHFEFDGARLAQAIRATFDRRATPVLVDIAGLADAFAEDPDKRAQWHAFLRRIRVTEDLAFLDAVRQVRVFVLPILDALASAASPPARWSPGSGWAT